MAAGACRVKGTPHILILIALSLSGWLQSLPEFSEESSFSMSQLLVILLLSATEFTRWILMSPSSSLPDLRSRMPQLIPALSTSRCDGVNP